MHARTLNYDEVSQTNISTSPTVIKQVINTVVVKHNVHESEKGGNEGFTYMAPKTWSGSAKMREVENS